MKISTISIVAATSIIFVGCGKHNVAPSTSPSAAVPTTQPAMTAWQRGDKAAAVLTFVKADWSSRPLFATNSVLSLSENQFNAFSDAENRAKSADLLSQLDSLKQLARAVVQTGDDASAKGDTAQARKCFTSLEQCGVALDTSELRMVKLVGQAFQKLAKSKLSKIGQ